MTEIPPSAFIRFRGLGERYRQAVAVENDLRQRLGDARQSLRALQAELARLTEPRQVHDFGGRLRSIAVDADAVAAVERRIQTTAGEITLLQREVERAEARKSDAGDLLGRCQGALLDLGVPYAELRY